MEICKHCEKTLSGHKKALVGPGYWCSDEGWSMFETLDNIPYGMESALFRIGELEGKVQDLKRMFDALSLRLL
jgi:hypothetical protein